MERDTAVLECAVTNIDTAVTVSHKTIYFTLNSNIQWYQKLHKSI